MRRESSGMVMWTSKTAMVMVLLAVILLPVTVMASEFALVKSTVLDVDGKPVAGAYIFFYDSEDTRRAVDLVSPVTGEDGTCEKEVPPGRYWAVARLKKNHEFDMGPLLIEDKFSGDPVVLDLEAGEEVELTFTVMDLLDTIRTKTKKRKDLFQVSGVIVNDKDEVLPATFAFANRHRHPATVPDFFSAWTDNEGRFTMYLPAGTYYLGAAERFTAEQRYQGTQQVAVTTRNVDGVVLRIVGAKSRRQEEAVPEVAP